LPGDKSVVCYRPSPALFFTLSLSGYTSDLNPVKLCQHDYFTSFLLHFFASRLPVPQDFSERDKLTLEALTLHDPSAFLSWITAAS
jgi:hypothetical protein